MTINEALRELRAGVVVGKRGEGCAAIVMTDGRRYSLMPDGCLARFDGDGNTLEWRQPADIAGTVESVDWTCDETGALFLTG